MSGVDNLVTMIEKKADHRVEEIIESAREHKKAVLAQAEEKAEVEKEKILKQARKEANEEASRLQASIEMREKRRILEEKNRILTEVLNEAEKELEKVAKSKKYPDVLTRLVADAAEALQENSLELVMPENHSESLKKTRAAKEAKDRVGEKVKLTVSEDIIKASGGVLVRNQAGTKWVDNTFDGRMQRMETEIRAHVASLLLD